MNRKNGERKKNEGRIVEVGQSVDRVKKKKKEKTSVMVDVIFARRSGLKRLIFFFFFSLQLNILIIASHRKKIKYRK